jgi:hypothetical protein
MKGSVFEVVFKRLQPRLKYKEAIWGRCSPPVSSHLEDFAPSSSL